MSTANVARAGELTSVQLYMMRLPGPTVTIGYRIDYRNADGTNLNSA